MDETSGPPLFEAPVSAMGIGAFRFGHSSKGELDREVLIDVASEPRRRGRLSKTAKGKPQKLLPDPEGEASGL